MALDKPIRITIEIVNNGISVNGEQENRTVGYVYKSLKKALDEIPGIVSVLKEGEGKVTRDELDKEEERINKLQEKEE